MEYKQLRSEKNTVREDMPADGLSLMKPFVKFAWYAMKAIAYVLIGIVKNIPKPHHPNNKGNNNNRIIKI